MIDKKMIDKNPMAGVAASTVGADHLASDIKQRETAMLRRSVCAMALFLAFTTVARAGLFIEVQSITLTAGTAGYVPVYISDTHTGDPGDPGDAVGAVSYAFQIAEGSTHLEFTDSPGANSDPAYSDLAYIFNGQSFNQPAGTGFAATTTFSNDTFLGSDYANDFDVTVTSADHLLLAYLPVTAATTLAPGPGDTFTISLVPTQSSSPTPTGPDDNTFFADGTQDNYYAFTSTSGTVTIESAPAAVPEPGSLVMMLMGMAGLMLAKRRRERVA